jgi:hypothetical protein
MRLGQLARKLDVHTNDIVGFLSSNNIRIEEGSNTRIDDDHVELIIRHFAPALLTETAVIPEPEAQEQNLEASEPVNIAMPEEDTQPSPDIEENKFEKTEIIKAPRTELPGLKVLGKIELPESKKTEIETSSDEVSTTKPANKSVRPVQKQSSRRANPIKEEPWKNPIALQRDREAKAAEEKRKEQQERDREKRMLHYLKKVKKSEQPVRAFKLDNEPAKAESKKMQQPPKTWLGKFWRWLSTPTE